MKSLVDPMPIITCSGKNRAGKMSTEITSRGYYSTKNVYYFVFSMMFILKASKLMSMKIFFPLVQ